MSTTSPKHLFAYALCGDSHGAFVNTSLRFLKRFTNQDIVVVAARCSTPIEHDQVFRSDIPDEFDNHQASILLKTNLHRLVGDRQRRCCYLDTDVVAVSDQIDSIFELKQGPVTFAADHGQMRRFSRWAMNCGCTRGECDHLRQAILEKFGVAVPDPNWRHWNGGVFLFDSDSTEFMDMWHAFTRSIFDDPAWKTRDQGTLIATVWKQGLQKQAVLPRIYNYIVDSMFGATDARRALLKPADYHVDRSYSLDPRSSSPHPYFLHFINRGLGARGWKNWDDAESLIQNSTSGNARQ